LNFYQYINALETDVHLINPRNNLERYGFTYVLKEKWGKLYLPRSFCEWVHGWYWWQEDLQIGDLIYERDKLPLSQWLLVTNEVEQKLAHDGGIKNVVPAGLPLLYATPTKLPEKRSNTLLAFIEHSAEDEIDHDVVETKFLDYLADVKKGF